MSLLSLIYGGIVVILVAGGGVGGWIARGLREDGRRLRRLDAALAQHSASAVAVTRPDDGVELTPHERHEARHLSISVRLPAIADADRIPRPPAAT